MDLPSGAHRYGLQTLTNIFKEDAPVHWPVDDKRRREDVLARCANEDHGFRMSPRIPAAADLSPALATAIRAEQAKCGNRVNFPQRPPGLSNLRLMFVIGTCPA